MLHSLGTYSIFVSLWYCSSTLVGVWSQICLLDLPGWIGTWGCTTRSWRSRHSPPRAHKSMSILQQRNLTSGPLRSYYAEASRETSAIYPEVVWKSGASPAKLLLEQFKSQNQESTTSTEPHHQHPQQRYIPILAICIDITSNCILGTPFIPCSLSKSILPTSF